MTQYLDRQSVLVITKNFGDTELYNTMAQLPYTSEEEEGYWDVYEAEQLFKIETTKDGYTIIPILFEIAECSVCHATITLDDHSSYCPHCGKKMKYREEQG